MIIKTKILIGILILIVLISVGFILYSRETCIDSNEQCEGKPDGTNCSFGIWCDPFGRICGGQSCVGLGLGVCINNKCESLVLLEEQVTIATDKTEYEQGEIIKITLKNNLKESIFSHIGSGTPVFAIEYIERKTPAGNWEKLFAQCRYPHCIYDIDAPTEIKPGQSETFEWEPLIFVNGTSETVLVGPGEYRLSILYEDYRKTEWKFVYSNEFTIKEKKETAVIVTTDKTEYALGEKAEIIVRNNLDELIWYVNYLCSPWWNLEVYETGSWKLIEDFSPAYTYRFCQEEEKFCYKGLKEIYYSCPLSKPIQDFVEKLEPYSEIVKIWSLGTKKEYNGSLVKDIVPGKYRLTFRYGSTEATYDENLIYSNEFEVKKDFWRKITEVCKEHQEIIEETRSNPECQGKAFRCFDGWSVTWYYDKRKVSTTTAEFSGFPSDMPKELRDATIAELGRSACSCENPIDYRILIGDKLEEVTCGKFYQFLQDYESSCGDCILKGSFECC